MALPVWGNLEKSQIDPEKIEEAIARLIQAHEDDANAHLEVGESLYSHKAAEIIDHLIHSIIADKLKDFEVTIEKLTSNKRYIQTHFESLDAWNQAGDGETQQYLGGLWIRSLPVNGNKRIVWAKYDTVGLNFLAKNPVFEMVLRLGRDTNQEARFGMGDPQTDFVGFKVVDNTLYAMWTDDEISHTQEITGITLTEFNRWRAVMISGTSIKFYINNILKATITTDLPEEEDRLNSFFFSIETMADEDKYLVVAEAIFYQNV